MMNLNWHRMCEEEVKRRMKEARVHLKFCIEVYKHQTEHSRYFLHEHPSAARSWKEPAMQKLMKMQDAILTKAGQCQYGLIVEDMKGQALAKKPTEFLTNSPCIASQLRRTCEGTHTHLNHRHANLFGGVAKFAQVYPPALCEAICCGLKEQVDLDRRDSFHSWSSMHKNLKNIVKTCMLLSPNG